MNPLVLGLLLPLVLLSLARLAAIYPRRRAVWLAMLPAAGSLSLVLGEQFLLPVLALDVLVAAVLAADLFTLPRRGAFDAQREMQRVASLQSPNPVKLTIANRSRRSSAVSVRDDFPEECQVDRDQFEVSLAPQSRSTFQYHLSAQRRGAFQLAAVYLRVTSLLGLWQRHFAYPVENLLHVYPDMRQMREYALLARSDRLNLVGMRRTRRIGQDNEFERLRDYTLDDNYKHIDWRSTARRGKLTVKDFQANQSQRVIFLVDCGRMMTNTSEGISLLDHAFNAALMLSYIALNRGDSVGLICFADEVQAYVAPSRGRGLKHGQQGQHRPEPLSPPPGGVD